MYEWLEFRDIIYRISVRDQTWIAVRISADREEPGQETMEAAQNLPWHQ